MEREKRNLYFSLKTRYKRQIYNKKKQNKMTPVSFCTPSSFLFFLPLPRPPTTGACGKINRKNRMNFNGNLGF